MKSNPDKRKKIVRIDLSFYSDTHNSNVMQQSYLSKINGISHDKLLFNLCAVFIDPDLGRDFILLPSKNDNGTVLLSCNSVDPTQPQNEEALSK